MRWSAHFSGVRVFPPKQLMAPQQSMLMEGAQGHLQAHRIVRCKAQTRGSRDIAHSPDVAAVLLEILAQAELQRGQFLFAPLAAPELCLQRTYALRHLQDSTSPHFQQMKTFAA